MVEFASAKVGDKSPCFITFEAGPTHDGVESAKRLSKLAAEAGGNAIKFQIFDPDRLVADKKQLFSYEVLINKINGKTEHVEEPLYDLLKRRCLSHKEWKEIKQYCDDLGLAFFATVAFDDEVDFLEGIGCDSIKIASADIDNFPLIQKVSKTGMCIQLDTGNATLGEMEKSVDLIRSFGNENIIIHHCPSGYPAKASNVNLNIIKTLKTMFDFPVAFSDHSPGYDMDIAALAMGANLLEKTITEDKTTRSVEHIMSLEPQEMRCFVNTIRNVEEAMGTKRRLFSKEEREKSLSVRRSIFVKRDLPKDHTICPEDLEYRRPGNGISSSHFKKVIGKKTAKPLFSQDKLTWEDLRTS